MKGRSESFELVVGPWLTETESLAVTSIPVFKSVRILGCRKVSVIVAAKKAHRTSITRSSLALRRYFCSTPASFQLQPKSMRIETKDNLKRDQNHAKNKKILLLYILKKETFDICPKTLVDFPSACSTNTIIDIYIESEREREMYDVAFKSILATDKLCIDKDLDSSLQEWI